MTYQVPYLPVVRLAAFRAVDRREAASADAKADPFDVLVEWAYRRTTLPCSSRCRCGCRCTWMYTYRCRCRQEHGWSRLGLFPPQPLGLAPFQCSCLAARLLQGGRSVKCVCRLQARHGRLCRLGRTPRRGLRRKLRRGLRRRRAVATTTAAAAAEVVVAVVVATATISAFGVGLVRQHQHLDAHLKEREKPADRFRQTGTDRYR